MNNDEEIEELFEPEDSENDENNPLYLKDRLRNNQKIDYRKDDNIPYEHNSNDIPPDSSRNNEGLNKRNNLLNTKNTKNTNNMHSNQRISDNKKLPNLLNKQNSTSLNNKSLNDQQTSKRLRDARNKNINSYNNFQKAREQVNELEKDKKSKLKENVSAGALKSIGVPSAIAENTAKETANNMGDLSHISSFATMTSQIKYILSGVFILFIVIITIVVILGVTTNEDDSELNRQPNVVGYVTGSSSDQDLTNTLVYMNLCSSSNTKEEEISDCLNSPAGKYFTHLKELYSLYSEYKDINGEPIKLNITLILETISYDITDFELFDSDNLDNILKQADELAEAQVELYQEYGDLYKNNGRKCVLTKDKAVMGANDTGSYYRISTDKYISYLLYGKVHENYKGEVRKIDVDIHPDSDSDCIPNGRAYKSSLSEQNDTTYNGNIKDGYIYNNVVKNYNIDDDKLLESSKESINEIFERAKELNNTSIIPNSGLYCSGVIVTGEYEGVYSLEDYVAGVVQNENNWYEGNNIENMKAQAIAARTYVLRVTNDCSLPIENSTSRQTMNPNYSEYAKRAASETAGQVLVDSNGKYISTEYDGLAVKEIKDDVYIIKQANLQIPADWINSHISKSSLDYYASHNHGRGMSQWGSRYLQTKGYNYEQILSTFYTNGQLITLGSATVEGTPSNVNDLKNRYYFNFDIASYMSGTGFGQCVWYAKHRAMEILASSNIDDSSKQQLIESIRKTSGNGIDWYRSPNSTYFRKSTNINDAKAGSIVSWAWTPQKCNSFYGTKCDSNHPNYGHVAIVESVYQNSSGKTMVTITEGWRSRCSSGKWCETSDIWSVVNVSKKDLTLEQLQTYSGSFNGYVYLY